MSFKIFTLSFANFVVDVRRNCATIPNGRVERYSSVELIFPFLSVVRIYIFESLQLEYDK